MVEYEAFEQTVSLEYVKGLEERIAQLESQLIRMGQTIDKQTNNIKYLRNLPVVPDIQLLSEKFITRAFAVWWHHSVAVSIITIPFVCLGSLLGN